MKKVTIYQDIIAPYRVSIFNRLAGIYELTVVYSKGNIPEDIKFRAVKTSAGLLKKLRQLRKLK